MDLNVYIHLLFLCVVNIVFSFFGIVLNTLVIASFRKSSQLRKKLCHFMIMVLSCFDLVAVVTIYPAILLYLSSWLREDYDLLRKMKRYLHISDVFLGFSFLALLVMSIERYLGAYYPIYHRTSVTKRRLLTLLAILLLLHTTSYVISVNDMIISWTLLIIGAIVLLPPFVYLNFKLFKISREVRRRKAKLLQMRTKIHLQSISSCVLTVACLLVLSTSIVVYIGLDISSENKQASNVRFSRLWSTTFHIVSCTLNSLIFFWKNIVLRTEGIKILKTLKDRLVGS